MQVQGMDGVGDSRRRPVRGRRRGVSATTRSRVYQDEAASATVSIPVSGDHHQGDMQSFTGIS